MRRPRKFIAGVALALVCCSAIADDDGRWLPNKALTPGAIAETSATVVCVHGYARAHRVWRDKAGTLVRYGIAPDRAFLFEDDDLIPVCLGGNNASPLNHWPQAAFAKNWVALYRRIMR